MVDNFFAQQAWPSFAVLDNFFLNRPDPVLQCQPDPVLQCLTTFSSTGLTQFCNVSLTQFCSNWQLFSQQAWPSFAMYLQHRPVPALQHLSIFLFNRPDPVLQCSHQSQFCNFYQTSAHPSFAVINVPQACSRFAIIENIGLAQSCEHRPALASPTFTGKCTYPMTHFCKGFWLNYVYLSPYILTSSLFTI